MNNDQQFMRDMPQPHLSYLSGDLVNHLWILPNINLNLRFTDGTYSYVGKTNTTTFADSDIPITQPLPEHIIQLMVTR